MIWLPKKEKLLPAIWPGRNRRFGKNPLFLVKQGIFCCDFRLFG